MKASPEGPVTILLHAWSNGDPTALDKLIPLVYGELRRVARGCLNRERRGQALQPTELVNEAYLRLAGCQRMRWQDRTHFLAVSARLMRRILVDQARRRNRKRGAGVAHVSLDETAVANPGREVDLVALDDNLEALARIDPRKARVVELRFFGGLSVEETAQILGISTPTVMRDWTMARAWLYRELKRGAPHGTATVEAS